MDKDLLLVLYSHNPSRLDHLQKLFSIRAIFRTVLILDDKDYKEWLNKFVDNIIKVSMPNALDNYHAIIEEIKIIGTPSAIVNLSEICVPLHAKLANAFGLIGMSDESALISRNKYCMRKFAQSLNIPVPKYMELDDVNDVKQIATALTFPIVVKPAIGGGSGIVKRIENEVELVTSISALFSVGSLYAKDPLYTRSLSGEGNLHFIAEELIGGETQFQTLLPYPVGEVSIESIYFNGECTVLAMHDKCLPNNGPYFEEYFWSTPSRIPAHLKAKAIDYVKRIHEGLGLGAYVLHTEFRTYSDELYLLEFGARMGGGPIYTSIKISTGNDFIDILISLSQNKRPVVATGSAVSTLTHCIWNPTEGIITKIIGMSAAVINPYYCCMQLYDDVGDYVYRAPRSTRSCGHIIFTSKSSNDFAALENSALDSLSKISIEIT